MASQATIESPTELETMDLEVYLLGPPFVKWAGRPLTIPRRQARALLYHLAAHLSPLTREHLCCLFWPDTPESTARRDLSHLLTHLRRALPEPDVLLTSDGCIALDPRRAWSDTVTFERLLRTTGEPRQSVEAQRQAVDLYRGPFLSGFSLPSGPEFEAWVTQECNVWECLCLKTLSALVERHMTLGNHQTAIDYAQRYLAIDGLSEEMHRYLIMLFAAIGDRGGAMSQFERCTIVLERELGVSPLPETRAAYQAVLEGQPMVLHSRSPSPAWTTLSSLEAPLIGRDEALRCLERAYAGARAGQGRLVLISGEPGIGKSRLMQEFVIRLTGQPNVITGAGHQGEQGLPYWPLVEALRPQLHTLSHAMSEIGPACLAEMTRLWPELGSLMPDLPNPPRVAPGQARGRLFQALSCWVLSLAARCPPLVLCLDDLHWADETSLCWLGYLARQLAQSPILVLGAYRCEDAEVVGDLRAELMRLGRLEELRLKGLSQPEVLRLIRHLSGQACEAEGLARHLHRATGGNPFFFLEILRSMLEDGILRWGDADWSGGKDEPVTDFRGLPLPDSVCEAIRTRLRRLSRPACQVLEAGAVIGRRFSFDLAWASSGRNQAETVEALDELLARHMISEDDGRYWFSHDLIRAVAYHDLSYGRRRLLHRRAGEALERLNPDNVAAVAWHFERAEEPDQAARYALQAGLAAKTVFAHAEARAFFEQALACLEQDAAHLQAPEALAANRRLRIQALYERGWALRLLGDMDAYTRDSREVARLTELQDDQCTLAHLRWRQAYAHRWFCRYGDAQEAAEAGLRLSRAAEDSQLEAMCQRELGLVARETGDYSRAQVNLETAVQLFAELDEAVYEIHTLCNLSTLYYRRGEYKQAMSLARQAMVRCEEARLPLERRLPLGDLGAAAAALGQADQARAWLLESLEIARQIADRTQEIFCLGHLGWLAVRLGRQNEAKEHLRAALDLAGGIDSRTEQSWLRSGLAEAHRLPGARGLAAEHARRALAQARGSGRADDQSLAGRRLAESG